MRAKSLIFAFALFCTLIPAASTAGADPGPGGFMSSNVSWVANIPIDGAGIGARLRTVDDPVLGLRQRLYVTASTGLTIYDVTDPAVPVPVGHLALPHWENEDVDVSLDGSRVIIAGDIAGPIFVVDTSIAQLPLLVGLVRDGQHIATCADDDCNFLYGNYGETWDITNPLVPLRVTPGWAQALEDQAGEEIRSGPHDLNRDEAGIFISDSTPRFMFDLVDGDPRRPRLLSIGRPPSGARLAYQHNNLRPRAADWTPRAAGDNDPGLRAGELMLANGETVTTITCGPGAGPFATWSIKNFDRGEPMQHLDTFRPANGSITDGDAVANAWGCSGHWFDWRDDYVVAGWYEHGTRFMHVDPATGDITELGYFQPVTGATWAAYWLDDTHVYTVDFHRGIDILRFDRDASPASNAELASSWLAVKSPSAVAEAERFACRIAVS